MKARKLIEIAAGELSAAHIEEPAREARAALAGFLNLTPTGVLLEDIPRDKVDEFEVIIQRRISGEPLQTILGRWDFYGRELELRTGVFIPRPETEGLVELAVTRIPDRRIRGLEVGVGSGAISVTLLIEKPRLELVGTDISAEALNLTGINAAKYGVANRLTLLRTSLTGGISGEFDFIISNPPYVETREMSELSPEVRRDPGAALDGGRDGLELIAQLISESRGLLKPGGFLLMEIHEKKGSEIRELLGGSGLRDMSIEKDLSGRDRYAIATKE